MRDPSGDQLGLCPARSRRRPVPSALMTLTPLSPCPSCQNASLEPSGSPGRLLLVSRKRGESRLIGPVGRHRPEIGVAREAVAGRSESDPSVLPGKCTMADPGQQRGDDQRGHECDDALPNLRHRSSLIGQSKQVNQPTALRPRAQGAGPALVPRAAVTNVGGAISQVVVERPVRERCASAIARMRQRQRAGRHARHGALRAQHPAELPLVLGPRRRRSGAARSRGWRAPRAPRAARARSAMPK